MKTVITLFITWLGTIALLMGGTLHIPKECAPKTIHILVKNKNGKTVIDKTLSNPKDNAPLQITLDPTASYEVKIETVPSTVLCTFKGTQSDRLLADPDLECNCGLQNSAKPNGAINVRPGKWHLISRYQFSRPIPAIPPTPSKTLCVKDPVKSFGVEVLAYIKDTSCRFTMKKQQYNFGEWKRKGPKNCDIHGSVKYMGEKMEEQIFYKDHSGTTGDFTLYVSGKRIGDCP